LIPVILLLLAPPAANGQTDAARARAAAVRALPMLQQSVRTFVENRSCVSCHHNSVAVLALRMAQRQHLAVDAAVLDAVETKTFRQLRSATAVDLAVQAVGTSDPASDSYLLMAAGAAGVRADLTTGVFARRIARWQRWVSPCWCFLSGGCSVNRPIQRSIEDPLSEALIRGTVVTGGPIEVFMDGDKPGFRGALQGAAS